MTTSPFASMEVFQPFRESRAEAKVHNGYAASSSSGAGSRRNLLSMSIASSVRSSASQKQNNAMIMSSTSSSAAADNEYAKAAASITSAYPIVDPASSSLQRQQSRTGSSILGSTRGGDVGWSGSQHSSNNKQPTVVAPVVAASNTDGDGESVMIEEKRRRANGDGFTLHQYLRGRLLGKGGFAKVYLCTAMDTGKNYAVKVVAKANLVKARARQKLQAEIKIHRTLKHKHVCLYKHYFEDRNNCYILLELCHNQSLNEMIKRRKRLTEPEAAYFMIQLLEAVQYMHDQSVIHRDLKLGNLFLDKNMHIKVGDLGLATRVEDRDEKRKTICGTPNYIAPEIIQGDKNKRGHSFEVDVWSMGVILFTILVGKPPYEAKDVKATYHRILANQYSFPNNVTLSDESKDLITRMLQTDPKDRPSLDYIASHPFLTGNPLPDVLPNSVLHREPVWAVDAFGVLVVQGTNDSSAGSSTSSSGGSMFKHPPKALLSRATSAAARLPFASRNPNVPKNQNNKDGLTQIPKPPAEHTDILFDPSQRAAAAPKSTSRWSLSSPGFQIYDEVQFVTPVNPVVPWPSSSPSRTTSRSVSTARSGIKSPPSQPQPKKPILSEETLISRTKALSIAASSPKSTSTGSSTSNGSMDDLYPVPVVENEVELLRSMVDQLNSVLSISQSRKGSYSRNSSPRPVSSRGAPVRWVSRYVDYTSKYGLGFLLNDGSSGVYFNDSTKTAIEPTGETFQYIERKRDDSNRRPDSIVETHTLSCYPESLKKKVTLLTHFRNYLLEQQKKADSDEPLPPTRQNKDGQHDDDNELVYVKKWMQTKHAILFRLSDHTIQVIFYDQTEVLLTSDIRYVTYVDKNRRRSTYSLTDQLAGSSTEMEKRLKYTKEILQQLLSGPPVVAAVR